MWHGNYELNLLITKISIQYIRKKLLKIKTRDQSNISTKNKFKVNQEAKFS